MDSTFYNPFPHILVQTWMKFPNIYITAFSHVTWKNEAKFLQLMNQIADENDYYWKQSWSSLMIRTLEKQLLLWSYSLYCTLANVYKLRPHVCLFDWLRVDIRFLWMSLRCEGVCIYARCIDYMVEICIQWLISLNLCKFMSIFSENSSTPPCSFEECCKISGDLSWQQNSIMKLGA